MRLQEWTSCTVLILTPHWSTLGGTRSCAAHQALASCCVGCWGDGCAAPAVSAAWPDWRLQRNVQTPDRSQLCMERENRQNFEILTPSAFFFHSLELNPFSQTVYHSRKITKAVSQWSTIGPDCNEKSLLHCKNSEWHLSKFSTNGQLAVTAQTHFTWIRLLNLSEIFF